MSGSTTADILFGGDRRPSPTLPAQQSPADVTSNDETINESKPKPRVQINLDDTLTSQQDKPKGAVPQSIKMRGNVLIQNPAKEWKVRICELNGSFLTFFRKQKMVAAIDLEQVGDINVLPPVKDNAGKGYIFSLHLKEGRYFNVRVSMHEDALNWVKVLVDVRDKLRSHISRRSKSFSNMPLDAQTPMTDFNISLMVDNEPDDSIKVYFDSERFPPSPIFEHNEKYIRPPQTDENLATVPATNNNNAANTSPSNSNHSKSHASMTGSPPKRAPTIAAIIASLGDPEAETAVEIRKGIDTSPWRIPFTEIAAKSGLEISPNSAGKVRPKAFSELDANFSGDRGTSRSTPSPMLRVDDEGGVLEFSAGVAKVESAEVIAERQRLKEEAEERYLAAEKAAREKRIADERAKKLAAEKIAAEKAAEEERVAAAKAAREAKEAAEKAAREQKLRAERAAKQAKIAADKLAEEERLAAEKAAKEAFMLAERQAREKKFQIDKAAKEKLAAEKAIEKAIEEERLAAERAVEQARRAAEREAIAKRKLADQVVAKEEAERLQKQRAEEAAQRKAMHRALVAAERKGLKPEDVLNTSRDRTISTDVSVSNVSGSQQAASPDRKSIPGDNITGSLFEADLDNDAWRLSRSFDQGDKFLPGIDVTTVGSPRSSFGLKHASNTAGAAAATTSQPSSPQKSANGGQDQGQSQVPFSPSRSVTSGGVPNASPTGLRFPIRKSMPNVLDPKTSFYGADGSFKPLPKQAPSPAGTRRASNPSMPGATTSPVKQPSPNVRFPTRVGSSNEMSPNYARGPSSAEQNRYQGALTMENVRNHTNSTSGGSPSTNSITSSQVHEMLMSDPFFAGLDIGNPAASNVATETPPKAQPSATSAIIRTTDAGTTATAARDLPSVSFSPAASNSASNSANHSGITSANSSAVKRASSPPKPAASPVPQQRLPTTHSTAQSPVVHSTAKKSGTVSFVSALVAIVVLVLAVLGGLQFYKNFQAEQEWRAESLKHLQAINLNQNSRSADEVSKPATAVPPLPPKATVADRKSSNSASSKSAESSGPSASAKSTSYKPSSVAKDRPSKSSPPIVVPAAPEGKHAITVSEPGIMVPASRQNELMRSSHMVRKFFRDLVGAPGRFIASIFSKLVSLFK